jgi:hypothetical protein
MEELVLFRGKRALKLRNESSGHGTQLLYNLDKGGVLFITLLCLLKRVRKNSPPSNGRVCLSSKIVDFGALDFEVSIHKGEFLNLRDRFV